MCSHSALSLSLVEQAVHHSASEHHEARRYLPASMQQNTPLNIYQHFTALI
jgi:hypothetical protein